MNSLNYALLAAFLTLVAAPAVNAASITSNPTVGWQNLYRDANGRFYEGDGSARLLVDSRVFDAEEQEPLPDMKERGGGESMMM